jgi:hypothetical protein
MRTIPGDSPQAREAYARYNLLTPSDVAARLSDEHVTPKLVREWIESEDGLRAVDLRGKDATRARWYVRWEWVIDFLERRTRNAA